MLATSNEKKKSDTNASKRGEWQWPSANEQKHNHKRTIRRQQAAAHGCMLWTHGTRAARALATTLPRHTQQVYSIPIPSLYIHITHSYVPYTVYTYPNKRCGCLLCVEAERVHPVCLILFLIVNGASARGRGAGKGSPLLHRTTAVAAYAARQLHRRAETHASSRPSLFTHREFYLVIALLLYLGYLHKTWPWAGVAETA